MEQGMQSEAVHIAAVVYDDCVSIDALLLAFARELEEMNTRLGGIIQLPYDTAVCGSDALMRVCDVASGQILSICQNLGPGSQSCSLDSARLAEAAMCIRRASDGGADLIFVSRFGRQEANGGGFRDELAYAAAHGRPVLTAVKRELVENWLSFTGGIGTLLDARLWVLRDWWKDVERRQRSAA